MEVNPTPAAVLLANGRCCGRRCVNCPYTPRWVAGATEVK